MAYQLQMLSSEGMRLGPAHLLWLATGGRAPSALGLADEVGDSVARQERGLRAAPAAGGEHAGGGARAQRVDRGGARGAVHAGARGVDRRGAGGRARSCGQRDATRGGCRSWMPAAWGSCPTRPPTATPARTRSCTWPSRSGGLQLPTLGAAGLGIDRADRSVSRRPPVPAVHGRLRPLGPGKESTTGHWELMGVVPARPLPTYPDGFPPTWSAALEAPPGYRFCCNRPYSGTEVIEDYGPHHLETGEAILYTSADSVLQIATHVDRVSEPELYAACEAAREVMTGEHAVGRVIARPFEGVARAFRRTEGRHDYAVRAARPLVPGGAPGRRRAGARRRQDPRPVRRRRGRRQARRRRPTPHGIAVDDRAAPRARVRPDLRQPRRDRPGLRPPPRRRRASSAP